VPGTGVLRQQRQPIGEHAQRPGGHAGQQ